jgi:hypothetical protein
MKELKPRYPLPGPMTLRLFSEFLERANGRYAVDYQDA